MSGTSVWLGAEPTFTRAEIYSPEWTTEALGTEKEQVARQIARGLFASTPGAILLRTVGRQYPGEPRPRWAYGVYAPRGAPPVWRPGVLLDPLVKLGADGIGDTMTETDGETDDGADAEDAVTSRRLLAFRDALSDELERLGYRSRVSNCDDDSEYLLCSIREASDRALRPGSEWNGTPDSESESDADADVRLDGANLNPTSVHERETPSSGLVDPWAARGVWRFCIKASSPADTPERSIRLELPQFQNVPEFSRVIQCIADAIQRMGSPPIIMAGYPPPVDETVVFVTVTPDPAVIEVNAAPWPDVGSFYRDQVQIYETASAAGLSPVRRHYSGEVVDSGGGGHLTLGGRTPSDSPFLRVPHLLPGMLRYFNRHPSLSYAFAVDSLGASSQSPRADEGLGERFDEFALALEILARHPAADGPALWSQLQPFLSDHLGNTHRSELNIEKLANPNLPGRGQLGLLELRALRMPASPAHAAVRAAFFRAIVVMLMRQPYEAPLIHWGTELHDRFALPCFLAADLREVLSDLERAGLGLGPECCALLEAGDRRLIGELNMTDGPSLRVEAALEFWPLVGDSASQERRAARCVDASSRRIAVVVRVEDDEMLSRVVVGVNGWRLPLIRTELDGVLLGVRAFRYRAFVPAPGLHPTLAAQRDLTMTVGLSGSDAVALNARIHDWKPSGGSYDGVPWSDDEALRRRRERFVVEPVDARVLAALRVPDIEALTRYTVDLRRLELRVLG
ncbi:MAG: transglutaminase family protein [Deltaproteobacteria bacterium]|nr:transglutaminase family protein [Deltaproteobacteria bacterium]